MPIVNSEFAVSAMASALGWFCVQPTIQVRLANISASAHRAEKRSYCGNAVLREHINEFRISRKIHWSLLSSFSCSRGSPMGQFIPTSIRVPPDTVELADGSYRMDPTARTAPPANVVDQTLISSQSATIRNASTAKVPTCPPRPDVPSELVRLKKGKCSWGGGLYNSSNSPIQQPEWIR